MATVYFSGGATAAVSNLNGQDRVRFDIPAASINAFNMAFARNETLRFSENGPDYVLTSMNPTQGEAVLQVRRGR